MDCSSSADGRRLGVDRLGVDRLGVDPRTARHPCADRLGVDRLGVDRLDGGPMTAHRLDADHHAARHHCADHRPSEGQSDAHRPSEDPRDAVHRPSTRARRTSRHDEMDACRHPCLFYPCAALTNRLPFGAPFCAVSKIFKHDAVHPLDPSSARMSHRRSESARVDAEAIPDLSHTVCLMDVAEGRHAVHLLNALKDSL